MQHSPVDIVCFDRDALRERARAEGHLWIDAGAVPSWARGALDEYLGSRIEERLLEVDALPRSGSVAREFTRLVEDQLYRARLVGFDGLSIAVQSLDAVTHDGVLCSDDSLALIGWAELARRGAFRLALPANLAELRGYRRSEPVSAWFEAVAVEEDLAQQGLALGTGDSVPTAEEAEVPRFDVASSADPFDDLELELPESLETEDAAPSASALLDSGVREATAPALPASESSASAADCGATATSRDAIADEPLGPSAAVSTVPFFARFESEFEAEPSPAPLAERDHGVITRRAAATDKPLSVAQIPLFSDHAAEASAVSEEVSRANQIRELCAALSSARGATSFAALEELFLSAYCPLEALLDELGQVGPREVLSRWAAQFQECYEQAFERMRHSRQRPRMVFDAPKLAFQLSRSYEAPAFELVLVDAFRFDVGQRVYDKLRLQLSGHAECVERGVLWAPLPSNTAATLELLARGADGLRGLKGDLKESTVVSIKEARRLRKLRVGPHSMFKLDAVQTLLEPGKSWDKKGLDQLAAEVSVSSARFIKQKPAGTLVFLFGDHGFRLDDGGHGGATPAEVLVPYQAWRVTQPAQATAAE